MPNLTRAAAAANDALRKTFYGKGKLYLLRHGAQEYENIALVKRGWNFQPGRIGDLAKLTICEVGGITAAQLDMKQSRLAAFSIGGEVWKVNENDIAAPVGDNLRVWVFNVVLTGESYAPPADALTNTEGEFLRTSDYDFIEG
jgi:hypothetical protein